MTNLRECVKNSIGEKADNYAAINREERNLCAILFHMLLINDNIRPFMELLGNPFTKPGADVNIYMEYAYARDLWNTMGRDTDANTDKKQFILNKLGLHRDKRFVDLSVVDFNETFGATPRASTKYIQNPGRWTVKKLAETLTSNDEFQRACVFKWAFNVKPDIVIHTSPTTAVCIEAKLESGEGQYPQGKEEKDIWDRRLGNGKRVNQTEVQYFLMEEILGIGAKHVFLQRQRAKENNLSEKSISMTWEDVFNALNRDGIPAFMTTTINSAINPAEKGEP